MVVITDEFPIMEYAEKFIGTDDTGQCKMVDAMIELSERISRLEQIVIRLLDKSYREDLIKETEAIEQWK